MGTLLKRAQMGRRRLGFFMSAAEEVTGGTWLTAGLCSSIRVCSEKLMLVGAAVSESLSSTQTRGNTLWTPVAAPLPGRRSVGMQWPAVH